jgi:hypothetical protein
MKSRELCLLLDELRQSKNLTMEEYTADVVSLRQYKRYLYGTSEMPYKSFLKLCDRLGWDPMNVLYELNQKKVSQLQRINTFYNYVVSYQFEEANVLSELIKKEVMADTSHETYLKIGLLLMEFFKSPTNPTSYANRCAELIHYPEILKNDTLHSIELLALCVMMSFLEGIDKNAIIQKLLHIINAPHYRYLGKDLYIVLYIHVKIAKEFGIQKQNDQVIKICKKAVEYAKMNYSHFNLDYLYYYLSLAYRNKYDFQTAHSYIQLLIDCLGLQENAKKIDKFNQLIQSDFGFSFNEFQELYHRKQTKIS